VQKWEKNFKETRKQKIIMMKKKIHAKKKIQGKKVPGARRFPQNCAKLTKKKYWCLPRHDSHDSSFCGNPKLQ
jgi:hypothetical protein